MEKVRLRGAKLGESDQPRKPKIGFFMKFLSRKFNEMKDDRCHVIPHCFCEAYGRRKVL
jgi:hypothetical protein